MAGLGRELSSRDLCWIDPSGRGGCVGSGRCTSGRSPESVHTDVGEPDKSEGQGKGFVLPPSERDDHRWWGSVVGEVVSDGAEARGAKVANHGQVGKKQDYRSEEHT